ncbi:N-acetylmuramoyl-L-alanine amidase [bacterium]|nr:N-acetylmuramoyl-L-alanine amidase [bacterium]
MKSTEAQSHITKAWINVRYAGSTKIYQIPSLIKDNIIYASLKDFAGALNLGFFSNKSKKKEVVRIGSRSIKVTSYNPFILVDDKVYQLALNPIESNGEIFVPLSHFLGITAVYLPQKVLFDENRLSLSVKFSQYNIVAVDISKRENGYIVTLKTTKQFKNSDIAASIKHNWLNITVYGGKLDSASLFTKIKNQIVDQILPFQFKKSAYLSLKLNKKVLSRKVYAGEDEIVISLRTLSSVEVTGDILDKQRKKWIIDTIIIDPGHGGRQPGCIGKTGIKEKEITLDIAKRLKKLLEKNTNLKVLLTHEIDKTMGLKERTQFANKNNGKLFISIHVNATTNHSARGFSTWVLGHGKSKQALQVAEKENSVIQFEDSPESYKDFGDAAHILNAIANSSYQKESMDLAQIVNKEMKKYTKIPMWGKGVYQAGFYVLIGAAMPRILIETAFLSNKYEERLLRTRSFRQKVAMAIFKSIKIFKKKYEQGIG